MQCSCFECGKLFEYATVDLIPSGGICPDCLYYDTEQCKWIAGKNIGKIMREKTKMAEEAGWNRFIKECEKFDYVKFENGTATGYMSHELPEMQSEPKSVNDGRFFITIQRGAKILIPFEVVKITYR